jgi:hypothetical protein
MKKPTIYLDTNIVSALHYDGTDINTLSRRMATRDWWEGEHEHFSIWVSSLTELELAQGVYRHQADCLRFVRRLKYASIKRFGGSPMPDSLVEESRETREQLLRKLGGLDGLETKRRLQVVSDGNRRAFAHGGTRSGMGCGASSCRARSRGVGPVSGDSTKTLPTRGVC